MRPIGARCLYNLSRQLITFTKHTHTHIFIHHNQDDQYGVGKSDHLNNFDHYDHIGDHLDVEKGDHYFMVMIIMFESGDQ